MLKIPPHISIALISAASILAMPAMAEVLVIDRGERRELSPPTKTEFEIFLQAERHKLVNSIEGLQFPEVFANGADIMRHLESRNPGFINRNYHCRFLDRVRKNLSTNSERVQLNELTKNGSICVAADLPADNHDRWSVSILNVLWNYHWLPCSTAKCNLPEFVSRKTGHNDSNKTEIFNWKSEAWDASYSGMSPKDAEFISSKTFLARLINIASDFVPGQDTATLTAFGTDLPSFAQSQAVYFADVFSKRRAVYFTAGVGPADMVDVLLHEYGHILFDDRRSNFSTDGEKSVFRKDAVHDEACAESLAWIVGRDLYSDFPEVEVVHILKLYSLLQIKPRDSHVVGFGSTFKIFEDKSVDAAAAFKKLVSSPTLSEFLSGYGRPSPTSTGEQRVTNLNIEVRN